MKKESYKSRKIAEECYYELWSLEEEKECLLKRLRIINQELNKKRKRLFTVTILYNSFLL